METEKTLQQLHVNTQRPWTVRVIVLEKWLPRQPVNSPRRYQRLIFADQEGTKIQGTIFGEDIDYLQNTLLVHRHYKISNAIIRPIGQQFCLVPSRYQLVISTRTLIDELFQGLLPPTPPANYVPLGLLENSSNEAAHIEIPEAITLHTRLAANQEFVKALVKGQELQKRIKVRSPGNNPDVTVQELSSVTPNASYRVTGTLTPKLPEDRLWFLSCSNCHNGIAAEYRQQFRCRRCPAEETISVPRAKIDAILEDNTGIVKGAFFGNDAEMFIGCSANELFQANIEGRPSNPPVPEDFQPILNQTVIVRVTAKYSQRKYAFNMPVRDPSLPQPRLILPHTLQLQIPERSNESSSSSSPANKQKLPAELVADNVEEIVYNPHRKLVFDQQIEDDNPQPQTPTTNAIRKRKEVITGPAHVGSQFADEGPTKASNKSGKQKEAMP